jgi:hypothetical protein
MLDLVNAIKAAMASMGSFSGSNLTGGSTSGSLTGYVAPASTAADIAAFEEFIKVVKALDDAQAALDDAYNKGEWAKFDSLQRQLAAAQAAYDATLPIVDPDSNGGGGGGNDFLAMSYGGMVPKYMANGGLVGYKPAREKIPMQMSYGGMVPRYMATGGKAIGSDTVPAMLTPGEFVMNKGATKAFGPMLAAMNGSKFPSMLKGGLVTPIYQTSSNNIMAPSNMSNSSSVNNNSSSVYNYNVGINVSGSNLNPQDIARAVMTQIKGVDSQRIRTQR